jgi:hypothetical protein
MLVVIGVSFVAVPPSVAQVVACNGTAVTVYGPTQGHNTMGTEGDDVISAPLYYDSEIDGLGGNDTICLVDAVSAGSDQTQIKVNAGPGDDTVLNESISNPAFFSLLQVELGPGSDHFVGAAYGELVYGADDTGEGSDDDTEVDTIDTGGGDDGIVSGTNVLDSPNHDVIATGPGRDTIVYAGMAGGTIDNGADPDDLVLHGGWTGRLGIDNVAERATLGGQTLLGWTAVDTYYLDAQPGSPVSFAGTDAAEVVHLTGPVNEGGAPGARIETGGGDDLVVLDGYLPAAVDGGSGRDVLEYHCNRAVIELGGDASCSELEGEEVVTSLAGVEVLVALARTSLDVTGTDRDDNIEAYAKQVRVHGQRGDDHLLVGGVGVLVRGGRGNDRLKGSGGVTFFGGRGDDILRGDEGSDKLYGGPGHDFADGGRGFDLCVAEARINCELR